MSSDAQEEFKKATITLVKEQFAKAGKYGSFILLAWGMGEIFLYFIQASLDGDPLQKMVVITCLVYAFIFPIIGVFVYAGLTILVDKFKD